MQETAPLFAIKHHTTFFAIIIFSAAILAFSGCSSTGSVAAVSGLATGSISPDIITKGINSNNLQLSKLKGSYVLVEFWESGNYDARRNHLEMERIYKEFKDKEFKNGQNFCVYSVSLDTDEQKWKAAVALDNITWPCQTIDTNSWNAQAALDYSINYLPKYYLLDGDGVIVKKNILIHDLENILEDFVQ